MEEGGSYWLRLQPYTGTPDPGGSGSETLTAKYNWAELVFWIHSYSVFILKTLDPDSESGSGSRRPLNPVPDPKHCSELGWEGGAELWWEQLLLSPLLGWLLVSQEKNSHNTIQ